MIAWKDLFRILVVFVLVVAVAAAASAQDDKYAKRKAARKLLKTAVENIDSGQYGVAMTILDSVLVVDAKNADAFYYHGLALIYSGDTALATQTLTEGTVVAPMSSRIKLMLARLHLKAGEYALAESLVSAVLAIKPREGEALYLKGSIALAQGDTAAAVASFEHALQAAMPEGGK